MRISDWSSDVCSSDLYGGSTYTTESFGIGWLSIAIISMLRHAAPLMCCSRMQTRRRTSIGEGCIGLAGLRRMMVDVGCQKSLKQAFAQLLPFRPLCLPPNENA